MIIPGPWRVGLAGAIVSDQPDATPMDEDGQRFYGGRSFVCESVTGDTARLISSAPELLRACKLAMTYLDSDGVDVSWRSLRTMLHKAIIKAEGEK